MQKSPIDELNDIINHSNADIYIYSGDIDSNIQNLRDAICKRPAKKQEVDLFLATYGGDPNWAYRLVSILRKNYSKINLIIPGICKSAGTLIALGADTLRFHEYGELGPLDVQMKRKDTLFGYNSGLDVFQAISVINDSACECFHAMFTGFVIRSGGSISTETAAKYAKDLAAGIYSAVAAKIDPLELGEKRRAMNIAAAYGKQLCSLCDSPNPKKETLNQLISDYPSHGFVIDMIQAKKMFNRVESMTENDYKIYNFFKEHFTNLSSITTLDLQNLLTSPKQLNEDLQNDTTSSDTTETSTKQCTVSARKKSKTH